MSLKIPLALLLLTLLPAVCLAGVTDGRVPDQFLINPTGRLFIKVEPTDARVRLSGKQYHDGMELEQGNYTAEAVKDGYETQTLQVKVEPGRDNVYEIAMSKTAEPTPKPAPTARPAPKGANPGQTWAEPTTGMEFVWVPGGCFQMGSPPQEAGRFDNEGPVHEVCVDGFWMGKYEITQGQWSKVMGGNPSYFKKGERHPVEQVSWNDIKSFISRLSSANPGVKFSLPSEAQWEYACRSGGKPEKYCGGNNVDGLAWYSGNSGSSTHPVGTKSPNGLGLYDMSGNVWEWCEDVYDKNGYSSHSRQNPLSTGGGSYRVFRGGSWISEPRYVRSADRNGGGPGNRGNDLGARLLRSP